MKKWEAHIWAKGGTPEGGERGRQLHLGYFDAPLMAAQTYDRAALYLRGKDACTNLPASDYEGDGIMNALWAVPRADFLVALRRLSAFHAAQANTQAERNAQGHHATQRCA